MYPQTIVKTVEVARIPRCDVCWHHARTETPAVADSATVMGPWGYLCAAHLVSVGVGPATGLRQAARR